MQKLQFNDVNNVQSISWPKQKVDISLSSPAKLFFTDFELSEPQVVDSATSADLARLLMLKAHVKLKLVVDSEYKFIGVVSLDDISDQKTTAYLSKSIKREEITVADLMIPKKQLKAFDIAEIEQTDIETVIHHLKDNGQQHCLVVDRVADKIRGIFSASDISRKLGLPVNIQDKSNFYKVFSAIAS